MFFALKVEAYKLEINKLMNVLTSLNNVTLTTCDFVTLNPPRGRGAIDTPSINPEQVTF